MIYKSNIHQVLNQKKLALKIIEFQINKKYIRLKNK